MNQLQIILPGTHSLPPQAAIYSMSGMGGGRPGGGGGGGGRPGGGGGGGGRQ